MVIGKSERDASGNRSLWHQIAFTDAREHHGRWEESIASKSSPDKGWLKK